MILVQHLSLLPQSARPCQKDVDHTARPQPVLQTQAWIPGEDCSAGGRPDKQRRQCLVIARIPH